MKFLSTFTTGLKEVVIEMLQNNCKDLFVISSSDDFLIFSTHTNWEEVAKLDFLQATYYMIKEFDKNYSLENQFNWALSNRSFFDSVSNLGSRKGNSFRIVDSKKEQDKRQFQKEKLKLEKFLSDYVKVDRGHPDFEIRFVEKENFGFIGIRITPPSEKRDFLSKGSINRDIASVMIHLSEPTKEDVFIDPFTGGGILPISRALKGRYSRIIAVDKNNWAITEKLKTFRNRFQHFEVIEDDFFNFAENTDLRFTRIVTDPPWGLLEDVGNIGEFYSQMVSCFNSLLVSEGIVVLITSQDVEFESAVNHQPSLSITMKFKVVVSGRNTNIYKILKK